MKKLILLLLVVLGGVVGVKADQTIYLIPGEWDNSENTEVFAAWVCEGGELTDKWVTFTDSGLGFYTATFEDGYSKIVLGRFNTGVEIKWNNQWNKSTDITYNSSTPVFTFSSWGDGASVFNATALYKLYVKNMDNDTNVNFDSWKRGNSYFNWPGQVLATETVEGVEWNVFYWPLSTVDGYFTLPENGEDSWHHFQSGGQTFDLSTTQYYNYYPTCHEHMLASEALTEPATLHFRADNGDVTLRFYMWNNTGKNFDYSLNSTTNNGVEWSTIVTHKPSLSIQFYANEESDADSNKGWSADPLVYTSGEEAFFFARLNNHKISKMYSKYYIFSGDDANGGDKIALIEMENTDPFVYKATIDNQTTTLNHYFEIAPESALSNGSISDWNILIFSPNYDGANNQKSAYELGFSEATTTTLEQEGWNRWHISAAAKYDIIFDFANMTVTAKPYFEREITDGYATFSSDYAVAIPEGVTAYYAPSAEVGKVNMKKFNNGIPANEGAFLEVTTDGTYKFTPATTTDAITTNLLKKGTSSGLTASTEGTYHYVFAMQNDKLCFYNVAQDIDADLTGKAYLETTTSIKPTNGAPILANFGGEDGTTGINSLTPALSEGKGVYTLDGRKLNVMPSAKGIYIVNGKKVIVK